MRDDMINAYYKRLEEEAMNEKEKNKTLIKDFIAFAKKLNISILEDQIDYIYTIGLVVNHPDIFKKLSRENKADKEGLYTWNNLLSEYEKRYTDGYLFHDKYMAMAHPFFRRSLHPNANYSPKFINEFWKHEIDAESYIAIDPNRVRINVDNSYYMEKDTWYGANFSSKIEDIPDGIVKIKPPLGLDLCDYKLFFESNYSLDVIWNSNNGIREFQLEEIKMETEQVYFEGKKYHPVKYIHSEYDPQFGSFRHFDGAIHLYTNEEYLLRKDSDMNYNKKNVEMIKPRSMKMFKFNGNIDVKSWILFTSQFLTGNPLIVEYFEGEYPDYIKDAIPKLLNDK